MEGSFYTDDFLYLIRTVDQEMWTRRGDLEGCGGGRDVTRLLTDKKDKGTPLASGVFPDRCSRSLEQMDLETEHGCKTDGRTLALEWTERG